MGTLSIVKITKWILCLEFQVLRLLVWPLLCRTMQSVLGWFQDLGDKELVQFTCHAGVFPQKFPFSQGLPSHLQ